MCVLAYVYGCVCMFQEFFPVLFRFNWHIALYKFKVYNREILLLPPQKKITKFHVYFHIQIYLKNSFVHVVLSSGIF